MKCHRLVYGLETRRNEMVSNSRHAFTLIELLVALGIIGLLSALLLPAVQSARESARRTQCQNNSKQIGIGLANYIDAATYFPAGTQKSRDPRYLYFPSVPCSGPLDRSFLIALLPFVEQQAIYDSFNYRLAILAPEQATASVHCISTFICPSDTKALRPHATDLSVLSIDPGAFPEVETNASLYSSSYAGCHSSHGGGGLEVIAFGCRKSPISVAMANGCITTQTDLTLASVADGLSHTMVVAEKSLTTRIRAAGGDERATRNHAWVFGTDVANQFIAEYGPNVFKRIVDYGTWTESASSQHPGGVNVLMGDGSVRFVKNSIDATNVAGKPFGVWQRLATRNGGEAIDTGDY